MSIQQTPNSKLSDPTLFLCSICWICAIGRRRHTFILMPYATVFRLCWDTVRTVLTECVNDLGKYGRMLSSMLTEYHRPNDKSPSRHTTKRKRFKLFNKIRPWPWPCGCTAGGHRTLMARHDWELPIAYASVCVRASVIKHFLPFVFACNRENETHDFECVYLCGVSVYAPHLRWNIHHLALGVRRSHRFRWCDEKEDRNQKVK